MKLSCQEQLVPGATFRDKVEWLEKHGFAGVEIWGFDIAARMDDIKRTMDGTRIKLSAMCAGYEGTLFDPDPETVKRAKSDIRRLLEVCAQLDCPGLVVVATFGTSRSPGVLTPHEPTRECDIAGFSSTLGELAAIAGECGVKLYLEPINRYESHVFNTLADGAAICRQVGNPALALLADTFHMNIEEASVVKAVAKYAPLIGHVHLSDSNRQAPGKGHFPFSGLFRELSSAQYDGYLSLECFLCGEEELLEAKRYLDANLPG